VNVWLRVRVIETWCKIARHVDAAEDGRAPGTVAVSTALRERGDSSPPPAGEFSGAGFA